MQIASKIVGNHVRMFGDGVAASYVAHSASRARASNVATIITQAPHGLTTGRTVVLAAFGGTGYTGTFAVTVTTPTTFTYANTGSDETVTTDTAGTITDAGAAGRVYLPNQNDALWYDLGIVEDLSFDRKQTSDQIFAPNPGKIELYDVIETKVINGIKWTTGQLSAKLYEVLMASAPFTGDTGSYTPNAAITKKFWIEVKQYDQTDTLINTVYLYCYVMINGDVKFADKHVAANWEAQKLVSTLNAGSLV